MSQPEGRIGEERPLKGELNRIIIECICIVLFSPQNGGKQELILKACFCCRLVYILCGALVMKAFILKY